MWQLKLSSGGGTYGIHFCFVFDDPNDPLETIHSEHSKIARENQLKLDQLKEKNESENSSTELDQLKELLTQLIF